MNIRETIKTFSTSDPFASAWEKMTSESGQFEDCLEVYKHAKIGNFYDTPEFYKLLNEWSFQFQLTLSGRTDYKECVNSICEKLSPQKQVSMFGELFQANSHADIEWIELLFHDVVAWHKSAHDEEQFDQYAKRSYLVPLQVLSIHYPDVVEARRRLA